jgi:hypothetical protein
VLTLRSYLVEIHPGSNLSPSKYIYSSVSEHWLIRGISKP